MPIYGYHCDACGNEFEILQSMKDDPLKVCAKCSGALRKLLYPVGISFKGSGFYTTDYKGTAKTSAETASGSGDSTGGESKRGAGEAKPAGSESKPSSGGGESKSDSGSDSKSGSKGDSKNESKSESNSASKTESKTESKNESKSGSGKPAAARGD